MSDRRSDREDLDPHGLRLPIKIDTTSNGEFATCNLHLIVRFRGSVSPVDVAGVMHCAEPEETGIDMYMGSGGAPEGVLAAAALKCMGGQIQGRLIFRNDDEIARARKVGIEDLNAKYAKDDMVRSEVIFAATGVTNGSILRGARRVGPYLETETILMRSKTGSIRRLFYRQHNQ